VLTPPELYRALMREVKRLMRLYDLDDPSLPVPSDGEGDYDDHRAKVLFRK